MLARTDSRARALVLLAVVALVATAIGARLVWWQVVQQPWLSGMALHQLAQQDSCPPSAVRSAMSTASLLATSVELQSVFATPPLIEDPARAARPSRRSSTSFGAAPRQPVARPRLGLAEAPRHARGGGACPFLGLRGIGMLPETKRVYLVEGVAQDTTWRRSPATSTSTATASSASRAARTRCWPGRPVP